MDAADGRDGDGGQAIVVVSNFWGSSYKTTIPAKTILMLAWTKLIILYMGVYENKVRHQHPQDMWG